MYSFEPHGIQFNTDVDIFLPLPLGIDTANLVGFHSEDGRKWEYISGDRDIRASSVKFKASSFSYFAVGVHLPGGGSTGSAGTAGAGGPVGSGGLPDVGTGGTGNGSGGSGSGSNSCDPPPAGAPMGNSDLNGPVKDSKGAVPVFKSMDGYAVVIDAGAKPTLALVFTDFPQACGKAVASHSSTQAVETLITGQSNGSLLRALIREADVSGPATYTMAEWTHHPFDSQCQAEQTPTGNTSSIQIAKIDGSFVQGTATLTDDANHTVTGSFNLPLCPLPVAPSGPTCCQSGP